MYLLLLVIPAQFFGDSVHEFKFLEQVEGWVSDAVVEVGREVG